MSVLKPWTNIAVTDEKDSFSVRVWGREYSFDNSLLPTSITSLGQELLAEPIKLNLEFDGEKDEIYSCNHKILESSDDKAVILCSGLCGNIAVSASVTIEYDGYMNIAVRLIPCGVFDMIEERRTEKNLKPVLNRAELSVKLRKEASGLLHFWPNTDSSVLVRDVINSGAFTDSKMPFKPCLWAGNEDCGLNICMESDENIQLADMAECIITKEHTEFNEITVRLLDSVPEEWDGKEEKWLAPLAPISYEIMLQATPVKAPVLDTEEAWRVCQLGFNADIDVDALHESGVKWVILHEDWSLIQNYCFAADEERLRTIIDKCHEYGMKVMLYFGYEYSSAMTDWEKNKDSYLNKDADGCFTGGWTRAGAYQKAFVACYNGGYSEEMVESAARAMDIYGADGIYTDGTYVPWECANEAHGCGYRGRDGKLHVTYPIKAVREHVKKLYTEVHKRGGIIDTHQSACCLMPTLSFCDTYYDGENIQGIFSRELDKFLNLDAFRCEYMGRNFGIVPNFIAYLQPPRYTIRNVLSISLIHGVIARPGNLDTAKEVAKIWRAYDRFGIGGSEKKMYWENNSSVKCGNKNVYISSYEKEGRILAAVSKFSDSGKQEELTVPGGFTKAYEIFEEREYEVKDGKILCPIDCTKSYMFEIE